MIETKKKLLCIDLLKMYEEKRTDSNELLSTFQTTEKEFEKQKRDFNTDKKKMEKELSVIFNKLSKKLTSELEKGNKSEIEKPKNKGTEEEKTVCDNLNNPNSDLRKEWNENVTKNIRDDAYKFILRDKENVRRPLKIKDDYLTIEDTNTSNYYDIKVIDKNGNILDYIQVKYDKTVTLINSGINIFLPEDDIKNNKLSESGNLFLKILNIEPDKFCDIFNNYNNKSQNLKQYNKEIKFNNNNLEQKNIYESLLESIIGKNNMLCIHNKNSEYKFYRLNTEELDINLNSYIIEYGGKGGIAKRINIKLKSNNNTFTLNMRHKNGGIYPTHMMCDF